MRVCVFVAHLSYSSCRSTDNECAWNGNYFHKINEFFGGRNDHRIIVCSLCGCWLLKRTQHKIRKFLVPQMPLHCLSQVNWWFMRFRKCASNSFIGIRQIDRGERISIAGTLQAFFACIYRWPLDMDELHTEMFAQIHLASFVYRLCFAIIEAFEGIQIIQGPDYWPLPSGGAERFANKIFNLIKCKIHNFTFSPSIQSHSHVDSIHQRVRGREWDPVRKS